MAADCIWHNARIRTMDPEHPFATALAARDGKITAVGRDADILTLTGPGTQVTNLHGKAVLPGFVESHTHALWGACQELFDVNVSFRASYAQLIDAVRERVVTAKDRHLIIGGSWRPDMREQMGPNPSQTLDAVSPDIPVALSDVTKNLIW